ATRSAVQVGNDVLFLADDGIRSMNMTIASEQQHELKTPLSFPIQDYINRINWTYVDQACAVAWRNLYLLAVPIDSSTTNNIIFAFNTLTGVWSGLWTNLPVTHFSISKGAIPKLVAVVPGQRLIEYLDFVDEASATDATYTDYNGN